MSDAESDYLLEDFDALRIEGHAQLRGGSIRASRRALASSESLGNAQPSSSNPVSQEMDNYPQRIISKETLEFVGFRSEIAEICWETWVGCPEEAKGGQYDLMWFGKQHIRETQRNAFGRQEDWATILRAYGLKEEFVMAVLNPEYTETRLTQSCQFWAFDTIDLRFRSLAELKRKSQIRLQQRKSQQSEDREPHSGGPSSASKRITSTGGGANPLILTDASTKNLADISGCTILWKGLDVARVKDLLNPDGTTKDLGCMASSPRGDFNSRKLGYYFTKEKDVAEQYAAFAKARSNRANSIAVCLVAIAVPHTFVDNIPEERKKELWYSDTEKTWSEYVWTCRLGRLIPKHLRHIDAAYLIKGSVAGCSENQIERLASFHEITREHLLSREYHNGVSRGKATQWFFSNDSDFEDHLIDATNGQVFLCTARAEK